METATNINAWRIAGWGLLAALLALPAVAMHFTAEVNWTALDFVAMGAMLGGLGLGFELVARRSLNGWHRGGMAVALIAGFLLIWINLAVGIIGNEHDDADMLFAGVAAVAVGGACLARMQPAGMARAMVATAAAQTLVAGLALVARLGVGGPVWPWDVVGATVLFDGLWLLSALMFHRATA